jgi:hypothetical protein
MNIRMYEVNANKPVSYSTVHKVFMSACESFQKHDHGVSLVPPVNFAFLSPQAHCHIVFITRNGITFIELNSIQLLLHKKLRPSFKCIYSAASVGLFRMRCSF